VTGCPAGVLHRVGGGGGCVPPPPHAAVTSAPEASHSMFLILRRTGDSFRECRPSREGAAQADRADDRVQRDERDGQAFE